jgi:hypothetical protein
MMVLNNNPAVKQETVDFKATIDYVDDAIARAKKLVPLMQVGSSVMCPLAQCQPASILPNGIATPHSTGHWLVPPGRQEVRTPVGSIVPYDTTIHYMLMHLHPYAESMELRDLTTGQSIWKGKAQTDSRSPRLLKTDSYSSRKGFPMYRHHAYELVSVYNNTTHDPVDAMASLWMYAEQKN